MISAAAATAVGRSAAGTARAASDSAVAGSVEKDKSDDDQPEYLTVKKVAKTIHVFKYHGYGSVMSFHLISEHRRALLS